MKQLASAYSFDTAAKTVTLTGLDIPLSQVLVIVNATRNETIYNFADTDLGAESYTQAPDSILTLKAVLTGMVNSDKLSIFYDDGQAQSSVPVVSGRVPVDIGGGAVPVSGTVNANVTFPTSQAVTGPLTDTQLRASAVSISQEKLRTIGTLTWATTGASGYFPIFSYPVGTIFRIDGDFEGSTDNRYTLAESFSTNIPVSSFTSLPLTDWETGTVVSASVGTAGGTFYYRKNNDSKTFLGFKKVSGSAGSNATATFSVYYESDELNQGRSVVLSKPLTDGQLRASAVKVDQVKTLEFAQISGTAPENPTDILPANAGRSYLLFQNLSEQPIHLSFSGPATTSSLRVDGGGGLVFESGIVPSNAVSILRTAENQKYYLAHA